MVASRPKGPDRSGLPEALKALGDVLVLAEPLLVRLWKSAGLTLVQLRVLRALRDGPRSPSELAAIAGVTTPSMARTLARLEERGLVGRSIDLMDRRRIHVTLRPGGEELLMANRLWRGTAFERAARALQAAEADVLVDALHAFAALVRREGAVEQLAEIGPATSQAAGSTGI